MTTMVNFNINDISEGVRTEVQQLNDFGFETCDSGDGSNYKAGMSCALPYRHVFGYIPEGMAMEVCAQALQDLYPMAHVEVSYSPDQARFFMLYLDGQPLPEDYSKEEYPEVPSPDQCL
jgi:hypothetical protein